MAFMFVQKAEDGTLKEMEIPMQLSDFLDAYEEWKGGKLIQDAFPDLNDEQREFIMTGITPEEWNKLFPGDEDDYEPPTLHEDDELDRQELVDGPRYDY